MKLQLPTNNSQWSLEENCNYHSAIDFWTCIENTYSITSYIKKGKNVVFEPYIKDFYNECINNLYSCIKK